MVRSYRFNINPQNGLDSVDLERKQIRITAPELSHQLLKVLRLQAGSKETVVFFDNEQIYETQLSSIDDANPKKVKICFDIKSTHQSSKELDRRVKFFVPVIKIDKFEIMLQKLVELGVQDLVPVVFERSQKANIEKVSKSYSRFEKIIIEAVEQCEGASLTKMHPVVKFAELQDHIDQDSFKAYAYEVLAEQSESNNGSLSQVRETMRSDSRNKDINLLVGPEGGITDQENESISKMGFKPIALGKRLLKAETAAIALFVSLDCF